MALSEHPQYEKLKDQIEELVKPVEDILEIYHSHWMDSVLAFDFAWFHDVKKAFEDALIIIDANIAHQYETFQTFMTAAEALSLNNELFKFNREDYEVDFILDIQRPLLAKKQELLEAQSHIKKLVT